MNTIFGGDTGLTYEEVQQRRKIAQQLRAANARTPRNIGEGIHAVARAISGKAWDKTAAEGEKALQDDFDAQFASLAGGLGVGGTMTPFAPSGGAPAPSLGVDDQRAMRTRGETVPPIGANGDAIVKGLMSRGMPEHIAQGFVMNMRDESNLNPGINEAAPIVPGSRGGFGLSQWTGPRRVALENYAQAQGKPVSDVDVQLDFLMHELGGSEKAAANAIYATDNANDAAVAIVNKFLRPAEEHRARRAASYAGAPIQTASAGGLDPVVAQLAQLASNPIANPGQRAVLNALLQQRMQASDPLRQLQFQKMQLDMQQAMQPKPQTTTLLPHEVAELGFPEGAVVERDPDGGLNPVFMPSAPNPTSAEQQYNLARSQGYEGSFMDYQTDLKKAGASSTQVVNNMGAAVEPLGTKGQILVPDRSARGGYRVEVAEGSEMDREIKSQQEKAGKATEARSQAASIVMDEIDLARELIEGQTTGSPATGITGGLASTIDSTRAGALKNRLATIKANIGFDKLQAMRDASPTGGALGQVSEFENRLLQAVFGSLEQSQKADDLLYNLERLEGIYKRIVHEGIGDDEARALYKDVVRGTRSDSKEPDIPAPPDGVSPEEWKQLWSIMSPEEKALYQ